MCSLISSHGKHDKGNSRGYELSNCTLSSPKPGSQRSQHHTNLWFMIINFRVWFANMFVGTPSETRCRGCHQRGTGMIWNLTKEIIFSAGLVSRNYERPVSACSRHMDNSSPVSSLSPGKVTIIVLSVNGSAMWLTPWLLSRQGRVIRSDDVV